MRKHSYHVLSNTDSTKQMHKTTPYDEAKVNYNVLQSSTSNTQYFKSDQNTGIMKKITSTATVSDGSSETFNCDHRPVEKQYSEKKILNKFLTKIIDPIQIDKAWIDQCPSTPEWDIAKSLDFMVRDQVANQHIERLQCHLQEFAEISKFGFKIHVLDNLCIILDFLVENISRRNQLKESFTHLLHNLNQPVLLNASSDVITYFESLSKFICFMGYLLIRLEEDDHFDLVSKALIWHLSAADNKRCKGSVRLCHSLPAAVGLCETAVRMLCVVSVHRFPTFLEIALLLACNDVSNCTKMLKENVLECLFYRFNPYFPERDLPVYEINPADPQDINVKLGASSVHISSTLSLLLVLMKTAKDILENDPNFFLTLPCPDSYSQRCFAWAYRYECRAREHRHERITLTIVASSLLHCFGERLTVLSEILMADILSLSVRTEVPSRKDWTNSVHFNTGQLDVYFKKVLIQLSVQLLKTFPYNKFMVESRLWVLGLMYLLDPGLCKLRARWSPPLFAELRKTAFQALISVLPITSPKLPKDYGLIRRLMWYIEWYSENPYQLSVLYWCLRVLQVAVCRRKSSTRQTTLKDLFDSHGIFIIIRLCHTLLNQKSPPVQKSQIIISLCLRLLTDALEVNARISCCVYPEIEWPSSINTLATRMLDVALNSLQKHLILSDRFLISLLNFIWEAIIWNDKYRGMFVMDNGVYKLLDLITLTRSPIQCLALALLCDVARAGEAVAQMVTWRASPAASDIHPILVRRGATIATLLAAIFRDECYIKKINLSSDGVLQDLNCPLMSPEIREQLKSYDFYQEPSTRMAESLAASDLAGSRMSKVYAILHILSKDLAFKVSLADEAYNLYKNIKLPPQDEVSGERFFDLIQRQCTLLE